MKTLINKPVVQDSHILRGGTEGEREKREEGRRGKGDEIMKEGSRHGPVPKMDDF